MKHIGSAIGSRLSVSGMIGAAAMALCVGAAGAADQELVSMDFANRFLACYTQQGFSDPDCKPVWAKVEERQSAELSAGVPATAGVEFDGTAADCSFVALNNNQSLFEAVKMMHYRKADDSYAPLPARKFGSVQEAYDLAIEHDLWPELRTYVERLKTCNGG